MDNPWDSKPSKISTFFSISVTALAFLAFAGYLLCMIVQAIKNKGSKKTQICHVRVILLAFELPGTMYVYPNSGNYGNTLSAMNAMTNTGSIPLIKYAKPPRGRKRRNIFLASDNQNETISSVYQQAMATPDPAEMYNVMIQCAEGYTKFYFIQ